MRIGGGRNRLGRALFAAAFPGARHSSRAPMEVPPLMGARGAIHTSAIVA
jgi:hypothetical protein